MQKAFLFVSTTVEVAPEGDIELQAVVQSIMNRALVVETPDFVGAAVMIGNTIITSLFLVRNFTTVTLRFRDGDYAPAVVTAKDETNHLAKLEEATLTRTHERSRNGPPKRSGDQFKIARLRAIGSPLFTTNTASGRPVVSVAGMSYVTHLCERKAEMWRIDHGSPRGIMGSGVWNESGEFLGLSLGQKIPSPFEPSQLENSDGLAGPLQKLPRVYALPAEAVLDFAERPTQAL
jgi:S1-C subfamily serine protease